MTHREVSPETKAQIRAAISNAYYEARNQGRTMESAANAAVEAVLATMQPINVIIDGPPSHESGRFVEVELDDGRGVRAGEWIERSDGLWALRIAALPTTEAVTG